MKKKETKKTEAKKASIVKTIWDALGSMKLFCILAMMISAWFFALILIYPKYMKLVAGMNEEVLINWFIASNGVENAPLKGWLFVLFILMTALAVNLAVCLINDAAILIRIIKAKAETKLFLGRLGILLMHSSYILIIIGHAGTSFAGFKQTFEVKQGISYSHDSFSFDINVMKVEKVFDDKAGYETISSAVIELNNGGFNKEKIVVPMKKTVFACKYLISLNEKSSESKRNLQGMSGEKKPKVPYLRVAWNPGMPFFCIGAALFFPGLVLRMFYRIH